MPTPSELLPPSETLAPSDIPLVDSGGGDVVSEPYYPADLFAPRSFEVAEWRVVHYDHDDNAIGEVKPLNLEFAVYLNKVGYCNYDISRDHHMAKRAATNPYATDYVLFRGNKAIQGGMHISIAINQVESNMFKIGGNDWKHYFERRQYPYDPDDPTVVPYAAEPDSDLTTIVEAMLTAVMADPDSLVVALGNPLTGTTIPTFKIDLGDTQDIYAKIDELAKRNPGFDYEILPDRTFKIYAPRRGSLKPIVFEQGRNIAELDYTNDGPLGTVTTGLGAGTSNRISKLVRSPSTVTYRRMDTNKDFSNDVIDDAELLNRTKAQNDRDSVPTLQFSFKYINGSEGFNVWEMVAPGDTTKVYGDLGWDILNEDMRIVGMQATVSNQGDEEITFTVDDGSLSL